MKTPLTNQEFKLIWNALNFVYNKKLDTIKQNTLVLTDDERKEMLNSAHPYSDLADKINSFIEEV